MVALGKPPFAPLSNMAGFVEGPVIDKVLVTQTTLNRIALKPGQRVLEVGPGTGRLRIPAARHVLPGGEVVGLDIQSGMVERLRARAAQACVSILTAVQGDASHPHFPSEHFDVIYMCTVLVKYQAVTPHCGSVTQPSSPAANSQSLKSFPIHTTNLVRQSSDWRRVLVSGCEKYKVHGISSRLIL